jgi:ArsR family transcriptional regulator
MVLVPPELSVLEGRAASAAALLRALANERRLLILCRLASGEASVGALQAQLGLPQSVLSQHLAVLREEGILATRRQSQTIFYRIADASTTRLVSVLASIYCPEAEQ